MRGNVSTFNGNTNGQSQIFLVECFINISIINISTGITPYVIQFPVVSFLGGDWVSEPEVEVTGDVKRSYEGSESCTTKKTVRT